MKDRQEAHRVLHLVMILAKIHAQSRLLRAQQHVTAKESWKEEQTNCVLTLSLTELFVCLESAGDCEGGGM